MIATATPLLVTCVGLATPVGLTPEATAAALRARVGAFGDLPYVDDTGERVVGAAMPVSIVGWRGRARLVDLLLLAFETAIDRLPPRLSASTIPLLICTREADGAGASINGVVAVIEARLRLSFSRVGSAHFPGGPTSVFQALAQARRLLTDDPSAACLLVAVDSAIDGRALAALGALGRLKTSVQPDGLIPGEAAGICLVTSRRSSTPGVTVRGLGFGVEEATVLDDRPLLGKGMASAVTKALGEGGVAMHQVDLRLSDVAGEAYGFEELALAQSRTMRGRRESQEVWHPAGSIGYCGAAAGLVQLAWFEQALRRGYAPGSLALAHTAATAGRRAAALLSA